MKAYEGGLELTGNVVASNRNRTQSRQKCVTCDENLFNQFFEKGADRHKLVFFFCIHF